MSRTIFMTELVALGYKPAERDGNFVVFPYSIPIGKMAGKEIALGLQVNGDFPLNPPPGPHVSPRLLPQNPNAGVHPLGGVHASPLGEGWQYWSRPIQGWADGERSARRYLAHIRALFDTL